MVMRDIVIFIRQYWFELSAGTIAMILLIFNIVLAQRLKAYKKLTTLLKGGTLEEHICQLEEKSLSNQQAVTTLAGNISSLKAEVSMIPQNMCLLRYNAFDKTGSDLSFSLALLNDQASGVVITSIFGREDSRVYAKPVARGKSDYTLSEEEIKAVTVAMEQAAK